MTLRRRTTAPCRERERDCCKRCQRLSQNLFIYLFIFFFQIGINQKTTTFKQPQTRKIYCFRFFNRNQISLPAVMSVPISRTRVTKRFLHGFLSIVKLSV